ncbi:MAG TPA: cyanophycinase, partial [Gemmatimonadaceae bacterium]|nr:cyanophycinase [Gemmatimonadaceae bacterium]
MRVARVRSSSAALVVSALLVASCTTSRPEHSAPITNRTVVGPANGAVMVVGGGTMGPELYTKFIELAGGPDALIVDVPTAGGNATYPADWQGGRGFKAAGAKHVVVLHTIDRKVADSDAFIEPLRHAGAVWFEGGRQWHLVDSYAGTKTEAAFRDVLTRGGIVGGSSAGASILGSYLLRGAVEGNAVMMAPGHEVGFGYLRGVAIDQHVVARERLRDLADSLMPRHPELLGISEDEGTAWLVRGDEAEIMGRNKAFVYGGHDAADSGRPFLTLRPGDRYNLATRRVTHRAILDSPLTDRFIDSLFADYASPGSRGATVLVAQEGRILVNKAYGLPDPANSKYMPATTVPNFALGLLSSVFMASPALHTPGDTGTLKQRMTRRLFAPLGMHKTVAAETGEVSSNVDELYRWDQGLYANPSLSRDTSGNGATTEGKQSATPAGW